MSLVSVVVPVYNVKDYLTDCVQSLLSQTYENTEIILVDDGSTDGSGLMCDQFARQDDRIKVFHKENGGLSDARNYGIDRSQGEYITFVDSDDMLNEQCIERLLSAINSSGSDVAIGSMIRFDESGNIHFAETNRDVCVFDTENALKEILLQKRFDVSACGKMYKKKLFNGVSYPVGQLYEDLGTTYKIIMQARKVCYINQILYYYRYRTGSITTKPFDAKMLDIFVQFNHFKSDVSPVYPSLNRYFAYREANCASLIILSIVNSKSRNDFTEQLIGQMRDIIKKAITSTLLLKDVAIKKKIKLVLCLLNEKALCVFNTMNKAYLLR